MGLFSILLLAICAPEPQVNPACPGVPYSLTAAFNFSAVLNVPQVDGYIAQISLKPPYHGTDKPYSRLVTIPCSYWANPARGQVRGCRGERVCADSVLSAIESGITPLGAMFLASGHSRKGAPQCSADPCQPIAGPLDLPLARLAVVDEMLPGRAYEVCFYSYYVGPTGVVRSNDCSTPIDICWPETMEF